MRGNDVVLPQPASSGAQLPRGHLLVLNRSFRRTLEAENKSPRTIEAYTDAVWLLATYCQAHGQPLRPDPPPSACAMTYSMTSSPPSGYLSASNLSTPMEVASTSALQVWVSSTALMTK